MYRLLGGVSLQQEALTLRNTKVEKRRGIRILQVPLLPAGGCRCCTASCTGSDSDLYAETMPGGSDAQALSVSRRALAWAVS